MTPEPWQAELERARQSLRFPRPCRCLATPSEYLPECKSGLCRDAIESIARALDEVRAEQDRGWCEVLIATCDTDQIAKITGEFNRRRGLTPKDIAAAIRRERRAAPVPISSCKE